MDKQDLPILPTQEIGSFRKPGYLIDLWRRYMAGEGVEEELREAIRNASRETLRLMEGSGLDIVWDGEMHRWEMYYHPVTHIDGIEFVGRVRVFDNLYFVKGSVRDRPRLRENYHLEEYLFVKGNARKPVKIPVTGPYTLADWSYNEYYLSKWIKGEPNPVKARWRAKEELTIDIARNIINPILRDLAGHGVYRIQLDEPAATTHPDEMDIFVEAFNEAVRGVDAIVTTHICYSDYKVLLPYMAEIKARQFTLEFANRDTWSRGLGDDVRRGYSLLKEIREYSIESEIGLGVIDVHTDMVEPVELIVDRVRYALKYIDPERLFINPDCGLRTRSRDIGRRKLVNMVRAVRIVRDKYL